MCPVFRLGPSVFQWPSWLVGEGGSTLFDKLLLGLEMFCFAHSFIRLSSQPLPSAQCQVQSLLSLSHGLIFQELGVWWGSGQCEERQRLFYCSGRGTHLALLAM